MGEAATALFAFGQQVLQQQQDQPGVCFAMVPLLIPAALIFTARLGRGIRRLAGSAA